MAQLSLIASYDASKPAPGFAANIKPGDALINRRGVRANVLVVSDNNDGAVFVMDNGAVFLQREVHVHVVQASR